MKGPSMLEIQKTSFRSYERCPKCGVTVRAGRMIHHLGRCPALKNPALKKSAFKSPSVRPKGVCPQCGIKVGDRCPLCGWNGMEKLMPTVTLRPMPDLMPKRKRRRSGSQGGKIATKSASERLAELREELYPD